MKISALLEKLMTPKALIAINLAIILAAEFIGGGTYFAESGLMHAIAFIFVALIVVRIFSDYAFSDHILRGFLKIQLGFFLLLGLVHVYEYIGLHVLMLNHEVVEFSATTSYFIWVVGVLLALEFVYIIYYKKSAALISVLSGVSMCGMIAIVSLNIEDSFMYSFPPWANFMMLLAIAVFGMVGIFSTLRVRTIMPVFREYSYYAIPAIVFLVLSAMAEYFEGTHTLSAFGISEIQNLYIAHFLVYFALSFLLVGFGKLKKPQGIYAECWEAMSKVNVHFNY
ncbi:MAG: hypothetical protein WC791_00800 [Candidatus Paceibacterota bacterium]|jgi:hypothetical protein